MKECPHCIARMFDDQDFCFECMRPAIIEPEEVTASYVFEKQVICIEVVMGDTFSYETHLRMIEGAILSVGSACENAIVIPQPEVSKHQLDIFFSQGHLWVEDKGVLSCAQINGVPLNGTKSLQPGSCITVGSASLNLMCA